MIGLQKKVTDTSIALVWEKEDFDVVHVYQIYCNGCLRGTIKSTNYTVKHLIPETDYDILVEAVSLEGTFLREIGKERIRTLQEPETVSIEDFGAVGDGKTLNTEAIQKAIDACPKNGKVVIPEGIFVSGALHLKSDMTICVKQNGVLLASKRIEEFPIYRYRFEGLETNCYASLLNAGIRDEKERIENLVIEGHGCIDANGVILRRKERDELMGQPGRAIAIRNAKNVYLKDITVKQSPCWCVHFMYSEDICCNHVYIYTKCDENGNLYDGICNGDGIDLDSCQNVNIIHSMIASEEDCISIKSGRNKEGREIGKPSSGVYITDCLFKSGYGIAIGSEMSGGITDVTIRDCVFQNTYSMLSVKAPRPRGGVVDGIICEDCIHFNYDSIEEDCEWHRGAIYVDQFYGYKDFENDQKKPLNSTTPIVKNITFRRLEVDTVAGNAIYLVGLPEAPLENIVLDHIKAKGKNGLVIRNVEGIQQNNVSIVLHQTRE